LRAALIFWPSVVPSKLHRPAGFLENLAAPVSLR